MRSLRAVVFAAAVAGAIVSTSTAAAQAPPAPPAPDSPDAVRQMLADARREIQEYKADAGGEHPAIKWSRTLWQTHDRLRGSDAGSLAAAEGVRLLTNAKLWDQAEARIDSLDVNDPTWERLPAVIYSAGIARNDLPSVVSRLSRVAGSTSKPSIKAASLISVGRVHRRQGDTAAATRVLEEAKAAAPDTKYAEEAGGLIYEIAHLTPGMVAPAFSAKARNARTVSLASLRGKAAVLVFWGTT